MNVTNLLYLDIETVPETASLDALSENKKALWSKKYNALKLRQPHRYEETEAEGYRKSAAIFAEFGKIICISVGLIYSAEEKLQMKIKSFVGDDENEILTQFNSLVERFFTTPQHNFCGHNIKEFDIPYICRRMIINSIAPAPPLQIHRKKPWEVNLIDTMDYWKFGDYKNFTSLNLLAEILDIPSPKEDINGSQVAEVYYEQNDIKRIRDYCEKDVLTTAQIWLRFSGKSPIENESVQFSADRGE